MWFGIAPAPAPSPRTNTKAYHPPWCTCPKHQTSPRKSPRRSHPGLTHGAISHIKRQVNRGIRLTALHGQDLLGVTAGAPSEESIGRREHKEHHPRKTSSRVPITQRVHAPPPLSTRPPAYQDEDYSGGEATAMSQGEIHSKESFSRTGSQHRGLRHSTPRSTARRHFSLAIGDSPSSQRNDDLASAQDINDNWCLRGEDMQLPIRPPTSARRSARSRSRSVGGLEASRDDSKPLREDEASYTVLTQPTPTRSQPANLVGHTSSVSAILVHDDRYIVSASIDGSVKIWSRISFECLHTLYGHRDSVSCIDLSQRWLVSGSHDCTLRVYACHQSFRFTHELVGHEGNVTRVQLLAMDTSCVMSYADDATIRVWHVEHGECLAVFSGHASRITCAILLNSTSDDRISLCSGSADTTVCFWLIPPLSELPSFDSFPVITAERAYRVHTSTVQCLTVFEARDGLPGRVFSCSNDGTIQWFDANSFEHLGQICAVQSPIYSMVIHAATGKLICSTGDGRLLIIDELTNLPVKTHRRRELRIANKWISSLQLLRTSWLACGSEDQLIVVDIESPVIGRVINTNHGFINCVRWLPPYNLVTSGEDNVIKIWSMSSRV